MKKVVFGFFFSCLIITGLLFALEHNDGYGFYTYYNSDGSLDFDTFYAKWDDVPDSYYIYLNYFTHRPFEEQSLYKTVGGVEAIFDEIRKNDISFHYERINSSLVIIFSPWNYTNAKDDGWIPLGVKRYNYSESIKRWNFMLNNMQ